MPTDTPMPTFTPEPTATPVPVGQEFADRELARIRGFIPFYTLTGDLAQLCTELKQMIGTINVPGVAKPVDVYLNEFAGDFWSKDVQRYSVLAFTGIPIPGQIVGADESISCIRPPPTPTPAPTAIPTPAAGP